MSAWGPWKTKRGMLLDESKKNKRMTKNMAAWNKHPGRYDMAGRDDRRTEAGNIWRKQKKPFKRPVVPPLNIAGVFNNFLYGVLGPGNKRMKPKAMPKRPAGGALGGLLGRIVTPKVEAEVKEDAMDLEEVLTPAPLPSNPPPPRGIPKRVKKMVVDAMEMDDPPVVVVNRRPPRGIRNLPAEAIELLQKAARAGEGRELFGRGKKSEYSGEREERAPKRARQQSPREIKEEVKQEIKQEVKQEPNILSLAKDKEFRKMVNAWQNNEHRDAVAIWRSFTAEKRREINAAMLQPNVPGRLVQTVNEIVQNEQFFD